jgi:hypothetical protein
MIRDINLALASRGLPNNTNNLYPFRHALMDCRHFDADIVCLRRAETAGAGKHASQHRLHHGR